MVVSLKIGPYDLNSIITGDARELAQAIPDESVDLIFTDPVYQNIDDYRWLAETAVRVLKPDRACLAFCGIGYLPETIKAMDEKGLIYRWTIGGRIQSAFSYQFIGRLIPKYKMALWYEKGNTKMYAAVFDMSLISMAHSANFGSNGASKNHQWGKHVDLISRWILALSTSSATVFDPFTGGGTVPAVCKMLGRNYLAFEIDPATADLARQRVLNTQPPLFVPQPEQLELLNENL